MRMTILDLDPQIMMIYEQITSIKLQFRKVYLLWNIW